MKKSMFAVVGLLAAAAALAGQVDFSKAKLKTPAALTEQAPAAYKAKFDTSKGVFVTTSYFPSTAYDFVHRISKRIVLIDGSELASLMVRHCVGVRVTEVYQLKRLDEQFFVEQRT